MMTKQMWHAQRFPALVDIKAPASCMDLSKD
jgi:hypothetical protein